MAPKFILAGILLVAFLLRVWGIDFGLPYLYHIDEAPYVRTALKLGTGILNNPPYDPTGFTNIIFAEYGWFFALGRLFNLFGSGNEFEALYRSDPTVFFLISRLTSAFFGSITVVVIYHLGKLFRSEKFGLTTAMILAVSFLHVRDSHYGTPDITMSFFTTLAVAMCVIALNNKQEKFFLMAGIAGGMAISTKWIAMPVLFPITITVFLITRDHNSPFSKPLPNKRLLTLFYSISGLLVGLFIGSFQILINPKLYWSKVVAEYMTAKSAGFMGIWEIDKVSGWFFFLKTLNYGLGIIFLLFAVIGFITLLFSSIYTKNWKNILIFSFPLSFYLLMGSTRHYFGRYTLPIVPFMALFATETIFLISDWVQTKNKFIRTPLLPTLLILLVIAQPIVSSVRHDFILTREDTRTIAKNWIEANISAGAKIALDWQTHGPPLSTPESIYAERTYDVFIMGKTGLSEQPVEWYREQGFDYLISSSFIYKIPLVFEDLDANRRAFYASLDREMELVKVFRPSQSTEEMRFIFNEIYGPAISLWLRDRPGPTIKIFRVQK